MVEILYRLRLGKLRQRVEWWGVINGLVCALYSVGLNNIEQIRDWDTWYESL